MQPNKYDAATSTAVCLWCYSQYLKPPSLRPDHQALSAVFVDQVQHPHRPSVVRPRAHEVVRPYMVGVLRPPPHTRSIVEPQPPARLLPLRNLQPFATPDTLLPVLANLPAIPLQQRRDPAVTIASILAGQLHDGLSEC